MNPLRHPAAHQIPENDVEKRGELIESSVDITATGSDSADNTMDNSNITSHPGTFDIAPTPVLLRGRLAKWNAKVESLAGLEARGITRVLPEEKHNVDAMGYIQMFTLWFSINVVVNNLAVGFLGPLVFNLGWVDCVCLVLFANALSACGAAYTGTFGPQSGNRTMVCCGRTHNAGFDCLALIYELSTQFANSV